MSLGVADGLTLVSTSGENDWTGAQTFSTTITVGSTVQHLYLHKLNDQYTSFSGGNVFNSGATMRLHGGDHLTLAGDVQFLDDGATSLFYDSSENAWEFQGNDVKFDSGAGIDFSATADGTGTTSSEVFDDYEEGTFTPVLSDGTNTATSGANTYGSYTKVGNRVHYQLRLVTTSLTGSGTVSGPIRITGFPFTSTSTSNSHSGVTAGFGSGLAVTASVGVAGFFSPNVSFLSLYVWDATTGTTSMQASEWTADGDVILSGTYEAA